MVTPSHQDRAPAGSAIAPESSAANQPPDSPASVFKIEGPPDLSFIDDLVAANRFKAFLIGRGTDVPEDVLVGLGRLSAEFQHEIRASGLSDTQIKE